MIKLRCRRTQLLVVGYYLIHPYDSGLDRRIAILEKSRCLPLCGVIIIPVNREYLKNNRSTKVLKNI